MGCAVETSKPKRRRKGLPTARPYCELSEEAKARARDCAAGNDHYLFTEEGEFDS